MPIALLVIYLLSTKAWGEFINYAVIGISTFDNKIPYLVLFSNYSTVIKILSILMPITLVIMIVIIINANLQKKEKSLKIKNIETLLFYSLSILILLYPISDKVHFLIANGITIIAMSYLIYLVLGIFKKNKKLERIYKIITSVICVFLFGIILYGVLYKLYIYAGKDKNYTISHYMNIKIPEGLEDRIIKITNYISEQEKQGNTVYILDAEAAIYMIPLDKYNKDYDMFLKGNIGALGEEGQIDKIKNKKENVILLIRNQKYSNNWQTPTTVLDYIRENLNQIGEVGIYEIYK